MSYSDMYNDSRADHRVKVLIGDGFNGASNVRFPYRGYEISLASDGADTCVFKGIVDVIGCGLIHGTDGLSIKKAIAIIDILEDN